jgi:hypothetical protein
MTNHTLKLSMEVVPQSSALRRLHHLLDQIRTDTTKANVLSGVCLHVAQMKTVELFYVAKRVNLGDALWEKFQESERLAGKHV